MDHSASRCLNRFVVLVERWGKMEVLGMGFRQHFGGQWVSDSKALLLFVSFG